nr:hypothetical protein [Streptomyces sp. CB01580]
MQLELLTGPLQGVYDPSGHGAALFAFFAGMAESEREYIREKSLEGQASARERGRHGGRPKAVDDDMADYARSLRANGSPSPRSPASWSSPRARTRASGPRSPPSTASSPRMNREAEGSPSLQAQPIAPLSRISAIPRTPRPLTYVPQGKRFLPTH